MNDHFELSHSYREDSRADGERRFESQHAAATEHKLERVKAEFDQLLCITMQIIGKTPSEQRSFVQYAYSRFADSNEMPTVRDVVRAILSIPD